MTPAVRQIVLFRKPTPRTILGSTLVGWWNADTEANISIATGISSWRDNIGAYDAVQATGGLQPTYSTWGGAIQKKCATFDAVGMYLRTAATPSSFPLSTSTSEIWMLVNQTIAAGTATSVTGFSYGSGGTNTRAVRRTVSGGVNRANVNAQGTSANNTSVDLTGRHFIRAIFANGAINPHVDGIAGTPGAPTLATAAANVTIGAVTSASPAQYWGGDIAQICVLDSTPTDGQIAALNAYFTARL